MAGNTPGASRKPSDILFDLTPEDDVKLQESDLLQLVNYGQLQKPIKVPGTNGRFYNVELALLWDEDYIDVFRKTTAYANDPLLRVRIIRRLKLHKAIQKIDNIDYSNKEDAASQRQLWTILTKLSDKQMECLNLFYEQVELERNLGVATAIGDLIKTFDSTMPGDLKSGKAENTAAQPLTEHEQVFSSVESKQKETEEAFKEIVSGNVEGKPGIIASPAQGNK